MDNSVSIATGRWRHRNIWYTTVPWVCYTDFLKSLLRVETNFVESVYLSESKVTFFKQTTLGSAVRIDCKRIITGFKFCWSLSDFSPPPPSSISGGLFSRLSNSSVTLSSQKALSFTSAIGPAEFCLIDGLHVKRWAYVTSKQSLTSYFNSNMSNGVFLRLLYHELMKTVLQRN
jgi:hypothetical protein